MKAPPCIAVGALVACGQVPPVDNPVSARYGQEYAWASAVRAPQGAGVTAFTAGGRRVALRVDDNGRLRVPSFDRSSASVVLFLRVSGPGATMYERCGAVR